MVRRNVHLPVNWDWRQYRVLDGEPPEQMLGTCWAHAAAATVEGNLQIQNIYNVTPSTQELIDCCLVDGGTNGGEVMSAFEYIKQLGITTNNVYPPNPLTAEARSLCKRCDDRENYPAIVRIRSFREITAITEVNVMAAVKERPLVVNAICGGPFDSYGSGGNILSTGFYNYEDSTLVLPFNGANRIWHRAKYSVLASPELMGSALGSQWVCENAPQPDTHV